MPYPYPTMQQSPLKFTSKLKALFQHFQLNQHLASETEEVTTSPTNEGISQTKYESTQIIPGSILCKTLGLMCNVLSSLWTLCVLTYRGLGRALDLTPKQSSTAVKQDMEVLLQLLSGWEKWNRLRNTVVCVWLNFITS